MKTPQLKQLEETVAARFRARSLLCDMMKHDPDLLQAHKHPVAKLSIAIRQCGILEPEDGGNDVLALYTVQNARSRAAARRPHVLDA